MAAKTPRPTLGTVLVKLSSSSVNPSDVDQEQGGSGTLGVDFAGTVVELGPAVKRLKVGDRVWGVTVGAYAEYITVLDAITTSIRYHILSFNFSISIPFENAKSFPITISHRIAHQ